MVPYQRPKLLRVFGKTKNGFVPHFIPYFGPGIDIKSLGYETKIKISEKVKAELGCKRFFFSATRHVWGEDVQSLPSNKGNDVIIKVFSKYLKTGVEPNTLLVLIEKGPNVERTKKLIKELGIDSKVVWLTERPRTQLFKYFAGADILFEQFNTGCFTFGSLEGMICYTAVFSYIGDTSNTAEHPFYPESPVVFNSKNVEEMTNRVIDLVKNPEKLRYIQEESAKWAWRNCADKHVIEGFKKMIGIMDNICN